MGFSFGEPWSLALVVVMVPLWLLWRFDARRRAAADRAYGGAAELRLGRPERRRQIQMWMIGAAVVLLVIALARPQWGSEEAPAERRGIDIAIALDVSRSMTAPDVPPSRAVVAADGIGDFLTHLRSDRVGLVIFSGQAFERSPLTLDLETLGQLVNQAQRDAELVGSGTDLGGAIDEALALLDVPDAAESQLIVVVSDGEDLGAEAIEAAGRASEAGIPIFTVAVGTDSGAPIPGDAPSIAVSRADRETLRAVASATGGTFRELDSVAGLAIEAQRLRQSAFGDDTGRQPIERFQWFVIPALILLVLPLLIGEASPRGRSLTRQHLGATALLGTFLLGACAGSQLYRHVQDGNAAYDEALYDEALVDYREALLAEPGEPAVGYNVGNTLHQLRRFEEASVTSADALTRAEDEGLAASLQYALGNHAVERGSLEEARRYYIDVLRTDPDDADAKANLEYVLARLEPPPQFEPTPEPTPTEEPTDGPPGSEGDQPGGADGDPSDDGSPSDDAPPDDGSGEEPGGEEPGDEQPGDQDPADGSGGDQPGDPTPGQSGDGSELGEPGDATGAGGSADGETLTVEEAQAALAEALDALEGDDLTLEEAVQLLDLIRQLSEVEPLDEIRPDRGGFDDR